MALICILLVIFTLLAVLNAVDKGGHGRLTYWLALDVIFLLLNTL